jgi:hypothetical protein
VAGRSTEFIAATRSVVWPTSAAQLMAGGRASSAARPRSRLGCDEVQRWHSGTIAERCQADAAVAGHDRGDALAEFRGHRRIGEEQAVVVRVHVDEAGSEHEAVEVDNLARSARRRSADRDDHAVPHCDVGTTRECAGPIDDDAAA